MAASGHASSSASMGSTMSRVKNRSRSFIETCCRSSTRGAVDLLEHDRLVTQLTSLERRTARGGKDSIDHAPGAHDDVANAVAGAVVIAYKQPGVSNFRNVIVFPKVGVA